MKKNKTQKLSFAKLFLTAAVGVPLAIMPTSLMGLPSTADTNVSSSAGSNTSYQTVGSSLNIFTPDKSILTWQAFGSAGHTIANGESVNFSLPSQTSAVLNRVIGGASTTIAGALSSNGKLFIINPTGIVIDGTAQISTAGFVASTVNEPDGFFAVNGALNFTGSTAAGVSINNTGGTPTIDATTSSITGDIWLVGQSVQLAGNFEGNTYVRTRGGAFSTQSAVQVSGGSLNILHTDTTAPNLSITQAITTPDTTANNGHITLASANGTITSTGVISADGNLSFTASSTAGAVDLDAAANASGNLTINSTGAVSTTGNTVGGNLAVTTTGAGGLISDEGAFEVTGSSAFTTGNTAATIILDQAGNTFTGGLSLNTTGTAAATVVTDAAVALGASSVGGQLQVTAAGSITDSAAVNTGGNLVLTANGAGNDITVDNGGTIGGDINFTAADAITYSGSGALDIAALSAGGASSISTTGNITQSAALTPTGAATFSTTGGNITLSDAGNNFQGALSLNATGNVAVNNGGNALLIDDSNIDGTTSLTNFGALTDANDGVFDLTGNVTLNGASVALDAALPANTGSASFGTLIITTTGNTSIIEDSTVNLGATDVNGNLAARSVTGDIIDSGVVDVVGTTTLEVPASTGAITLDSNNILGGAITVTNANSIALRNTVNTAITASNAIAGHTQIDLNGAGTPTLTANASNWNSFGLTSTQNVGAVTISDNNSITLQDFAPAGAATVTVSAGQAAGGGGIVIGSGYASSTSAATTFNATANGGGNITDTAGGSFAGPVTFNVDGNLVLDSAHTFGGTGDAVTVAATAGDDITITSAGVIELGDIDTSGDGNFVLNSGGAVTQAGGTNVDIAGTGTSQIWALSSNVTLGAADNDFGNSLQLNTGGNATIVTDNALALASTNNVYGTLSINTGGNNLTQSSGSYLRTVGNTTLNTGAGNITLNNTGNNFGGLALTANNATVRERETTRFMASTLGGTLTSTSTTGDLIDSGALNVTGTSTFSTPAGSVLLDVATNQFGNVSITAAGNAYISDSAGNINLLGGTNVGGTLDVKLVGGGDITDGGALTVFGNTTFDAGTGDVIVNDPNNSFGAVRFVAGAGGAIIVENSTLNLRTGSFSSGPVFLTSFGDIVSLTDTSGVNTFGSTVTMNADGDIVLADVFAITGQLTIDSNSDVDLSALTITGADLNGITPVVTADGTYTAPNP